MAAKKKAAKKKAAKKKTSKPAKKKTAVKKKPVKKVTKKTVKKAVKKAAKKSMPKKPAKSKVKSKVKKFITKTREELKKPIKRRRNIPTPTRTYLGQRELNHFRNMILEEKKDILENQKRLLDSLVDTNTGDYVGDNQTYSMHMAEQGTDEMEREKAYMFMQRDEKYLGYLEEALKRIEDKTYGICIMCKNEPLGLCRTCPFIPKGRLEVVPVTQHCVECKALKST